MNAQKIRVAEPIALPLSIIMNQQPERCAYGPYVPSIKCVCVCGKFVAHSQKHTHPLLDQPNALLITHQFQSDRTGCKTVI